MKKKMGTISNPTPEKKTRQVFLHIAGELGCKKELQILFDKYDKLLNRCTNDQEREHITAIALSEINQLLNSAKELDYTLVDKTPKIIEP